MGTSFPTYYHEEGKEWHRTKESAIAKAEEMRKKKIASLQKQIKKLENINFEQGILIWVMIVAEPAAIVKNQKKPENGFASMT